MAILERDGAWAVKVYRGVRDRKKEYEWVGTFRFEDYGGKRAARRAAVAAEEKALGRKNRRGPVPTCDAFAEAWTEEYTIVKKGPTRGQRKSAASLRGYRDELKPFRKDPRFKRVPLDEADRRDARAYATERPRSAVVVRNMFSDAVDDGLCDTNPFSGLNLEEMRGRSDYPAITEVELHDLAACAIVEHGEKYGQVYAGHILGAGYVGWRLTEGLNLERRDFRPREREIDLRVTKFSKPRTVLLLPEAWDALKDIPRRTEHDRIFYGKRGGELTKGNHQSLWSPVRSMWWGKLSAPRRKELVDFDWHSLRHFNGHYFYIVRGFGSELAAYQLGHADPSLIEQRYGKPFQGALDRLKMAAQSPKVVPMRVAKEAQEGAG
jgi:integrase